MQWAQVTKSLKFHIQFHFISSSSDVFIFNEFTVADQQASHISELRCNGDERQPTTIGSTINTHTSPQPECDCHHAQQLIRPPTSGLYKNTLLTTLQLEKHKQNAMDYIQL